MRYTLTTLLHTIGFGGLTAAIECHRQGHEVEVYESFPGKITILPIHAIMTLIDHAELQNLRFLAI